MYRGFVLVDCFRYVVFFKHVSLYQQPSSDLFCKASPGNSDLIRTPGIVSTSFSAGDRVSRPIHETGFARLVDIWKMQ